MGKELVLAGACAVAPGMLVFGRDRRSGAIIPVCPDCGCAFPDFPRPPMTLEDYRSADLVCAEGIVIASYREVREAGLVDAIAGRVEARDFGWSLEVFSGLGSDSRAESESRE